MPAVTESCRSSVASRGQATGDKIESVILLHGVWMHGHVMWPHQHWLRAEGFVVHRFSYPSWSGGLQGNIGRLTRYINNTPGSVIHVVAHSLGGLITLRMLAQNPDVRLGRVVLLGTPCAGCHCGETLAATPLLKRLVGQTFSDWLRLPRPVLPPATEIGIIAGTRRLGVGRFIPGLKRPNDGLIALEETFLGTARDSIALNVSHSGMLVSRACSRQVVSFLRSGKFLQA